MITKGYLLIHSDGSSYEPYETILGFSENKRELDQKAFSFNKEREECLNRFENCSEFISEYENRFDTFREINGWNLTKEKFTEWLKDNPIPQEIDEFVQFLERSKEEQKAENFPYEVSLNSPSPHELMDSYYVQSFGLTFNDV